MSKKAIIPEGAVIVGPYSPAVEAGDLIFVSGQVPVDGTTGKIVEGDIQDQVKQCFVNLKKVLDTAGVSFDNIVKSTVYLTDIADFKAVNEIYAQYFNAPYPARTAIAVAALPLGAGVEIEVIVKK